MNTVVLPMEELAEIVKFQLNNGGKAKLKISGSSMQPMLKSRRDEVVLVPPDAPRIGDVVLFLRESGAYVFHRIIAIEEGKYICCGDNQAIREPVDREQVVAIMDGFVRNGKYYSKNAFGYRIYQFIWVKFFFLRPGYIYLRRHLAPWYRRNKRKKA